MKKTNEAFYKLMSQNESMKNTSGFKNDKNDKTERSIHMHTVTKKEAYII